MTISLPRYAYRVQDLLVKILKLSRGLGRARDSQHRPRDLRNRRPKYVHDNIAAAIIEIAPATFKEEKLAVGSSRPRFHISPPRHSLQKGLFLWSSEKEDRARDITISRPRYLYEVNKKLAVEDLAPAIVYFAPAI